LLVLQCCQQNTAAVCLLVAAVASVSTTSGSATVCIANTVLGDARALLQWLLRSSMLALHGMLLALGWGGRRVLLLLALLPRVVLVLL
jgi:hypothetical protein